MHYHSPKKKKCRFDISCHKMKKKIFILGQKPKFSSTAEWTEYSVVPA